MISGPFLKVAAPEKPGAASVFLYFSLPMAA